MESYKIRGAEVITYTAFAPEPSRGNPAGVALEPGDLDDADHRL